MVRSFSMTSRTTCSLNSSEYLAAGMVSILSTHGKKNSPSPRNTTHPNEDWQLADPAGQDLATVRVIRDEIQARVRELVAILQP